MKNTYMKSVGGFTLVEIVISITISVIILTGVLFFLQKLQRDILISEQGTYVNTELTDFMAVMRNFSKLYDSGSVIVEGSGSYGAALLMKSDKSSGVLIGIVKDGGSGSLSKLDAPGDKNIYGKKVIAYQKLAPTQITTVLANTGSIYDINFYDEGLFKHLLVTDFSIIPYNSGSIFEYTLKIEVPYYPKFEGMSRLDADLPVSMFSFTLDF